MTMPGLPIDLTQAATGELLVAQALIEQTQNAPGEFDGWITVDAKFLGEVQALPVSGIYQSMTSILDRLYQLSAVTYTDNGGERHVPALIGNHTPSNKPLRPEPCGWAVS